MRPLRFINRITPPFLWDFAKRLVARDGEAAPAPFVHESVRSYSQFGEDLVLDALLGCPADGVFVDVGANDPETLSNTRRFYDRGWRGINVEPNTEVCVELHRQRPEDINLNIGVAPEEGLLTFYRMDPSTLSAFEKNAVQDNLAHPGARLVEEVQVPVERLRQVLEKHLGDRKIDFLSVDTEGLDLSVLRSNDWDAFRPRFVLVEIAWMGKEIVDYLGTQGYTFVWSNGVNGIFSDSAAAS